MARGIGQPMAVLVLSDEERSYLERQARRRRVARSLSDRCRMILRCADGLTNKAVAAELGVHEHTVGKWRRSFLKERIDGLSDEPRPGRPRTLTDEKVAAVIERTLETTPADATHWSLRSWPGRAGCRTRRSGGYGRPSACSRTARRPSSCRAIRCSWTRSATSSGSICRRRTARWCSVSTKKARSRHSIAHSRCCRACLSAAHTTTSVTARPRCSPPSMSPPASSSESATGATGPGSSSTS